MRRPCASDARDWRSITISVMRHKGVCAKIDNFQPSICFLNKNSRRLAGASLRFLHAKTRKNRHLTSSGPIGRPPGGLTNLMLRRGGQNPPNRNRFTDASTSAKRAQGIRGFRQGVRACAPTCLTPRRSHRMNSSRIKRKQIFSF